MDTSKEYIKMCEKAEEIQKEYRPKTGDFQANKILLKVTVYSGKYPFNPKKIWLPRQDQLQEMVGKIYNRYGLIKDFCDFSEDWEGQPDVSMEQLWLAFVMKEKYQKTWDGKEWVK